MGGGEAEHHIASGRREAVDALYYIGGQPFRYKRHGQHDSGHSQSAAVGNHAYVYHHAHTYKKVGYEQGVAYKFYAAHKR